MRFPFALAALVSFISLAMPTDARAQFTCVAGPPATCTNTGTEPADFPPGPPIFPFDLNIVNSGTAQNITNNTAAGGSSFVNNSGTALDLTANTVNTGNATVLNTGTAGNLSATTESGTATATNSGLGASANSISATTNLGGNAVSNNSGTVAGNITTRTFSGGNASTTNRGNVTGDILTRVTGIGDAITNNFGTANSLATRTQTGTATTNNYGTTDFMYARTTAGGNAFAYNAGTVVNATGGNLFIPGFGFPTGVLAYASGATGNATAINTGNAASTNSNWPGMMSVSDGGNALSINYGSAAGIYTIGGYNGGNGNATTINFGTVTNGGIISFGGYFFGDGNANVFNAGRVYGGIGAFVEGIGSATISNAGLVDGRTSMGGIAISLAQSSIGTPTTLNILPGSRIIGFIDLNGSSFFPGTGTQINIFGGADISSVLTFGGGCGCFNSLIATGSTVNVFGGAPFVISGNTVAILDPTSFALQDKNIADFSHTISSMVTSRLNNPASMSGGSTPIGFAPSGSVAADMARDAFAGISSLNYASTDRVLFSNPSVTAADGTSVWAQGFAGQRIQDADAPTLRSVNNFYGGMVGVDKAFRPGLRIGGLLGAGAIESTADLNSGDTKSNVVFGGMYGRYAMNRAFFDFSLLGGHSNNDLRRTMANNLVPGGLETATASYEGWFVSPEIAYGVKMPIAANLTMTPTGRVRYLAAGFGGYQESGSTTNLTVASRTSHNFEERGEVTFTHTSNPVPSQRMQISGTVGLLALQRAGDTTVNTILLGQNLPFATPGKNDVFGGYGGIGFDWRHVSGWTVFGAAEYTATTDSSRTATTKGGVKVTF